MIKLSPNQIFLLNRAGYDEKYCAYALRTYIQSRGVEWSDLATELNCDEQSLLKLALCRKFEIQSPDFSETVEIVSKYSGIDAYLIASIIKKAEFSADLISNNDNSIIPLPYTYLAAAREKTDTSSEDQP